VGGLSSPGLPTRREFNNEPAAVRVIVADANEGLMISHDRRHNREP
jgi:hypothetical protein